VVGASTYSGFSVLGCGRCKDANGADPRRYYKVGTTVNSCHSACGDECNAFEAEETGDQTCYVYYETGNPGMGWTEESSSNIAAVSTTAGSGFPTGCNYKPPTTALVSEMAEADEDSEIEVL